ncbi:MAG: type 2 isopentenyl-diphosphate Delta-isomerase [Candidatus Wukongarchaeota archaeon]|nr:type 2 isopentenyl-diphosphate Delta-isomerase [Candidatus Wukongarchaeota archaeon]
MLSFIVLVGVVPLEDLITNQTINRKSEHVDIALSELINAISKESGFNDVDFIHCATPELDLSDIDTRVTLLGRELSAPIIIAAMTGGYPRAKLINGTLAEAAEILNIGMGVGSQRAAIQNPALENTFSITRKKAPNALLIGNIGAPQLNLGFGIKEIKKTVEMINADALAIHLNPLQEAVQPEGDTNFSNILEKISEICLKVDFVKIVAKETGTGISMEVGKKLEECGVSAIDIGGAGGTSFSAVEKYRAKMQKNIVFEKIGEKFWDWGIPTAQSTVEVAASTSNVEIISTGGIRSGIDVAKAIALGADATGIAYPLLKPAYGGDVGTAIKIIEEYIRELRTTMFLIGVKNIEELKKASLLITGNLAERLRLRNIDPKRYVNRKC